MIQANNRPNEMGPPPIPIPSQRSGSKSRARLFPPRTTTITIIKFLLLCLSILTFAQNPISQEFQATSTAPFEPLNDETMTNPSSAGKQRQQIEQRAARAVELARVWALRFGREVHQGTQAATCYRAIRNQFNPAKSDPARRGPYRASVVSVDWTRLHADIVKTISTTMGWHENAVAAIVEASESLSANHTYDENLPDVDYVDVHRLHNIDEMMFEEGADQDLSPALELGSDQGGAQQQFPDTSTAVAGLEAVGGGSMVDQSESSLDRDRISPPDSGGAPPLDPNLERLRRSRPRESLGEKRDQMPTPQPLVLQPAGTPMPQDEGAQGEWQTPVKYAKLSRHPNFGEILVNTEMSAVHVPVHIYPGNPVVKNAIAWSEELTRVFKNNMVQNPRLNNQYFASPHGFMRVFPAQKWPIARTDPDLYDARMRPWYSAGASSRKDVLILVDASGSMTGSRRDIAKGVVFEILDTLTHNDHFMVLRFNDYVQQVGVPPCRAMRSQRGRTKIPLKNTMLSPTLAAASGSSSGSASASASAVGSQSNSGGSSSGNQTTDIDSLYLLPATGRNVRHVKTNFTIPTSGIANFSHALVTAFEVLQKYQGSETLGSQCNQAIMLITDGSPSDFEDIFSRYNYPNAPVRVFTYLIGRETGDGAHTKMMACHNRGFYTHVINLAEVRETVQQYISVMARPLVLNRTHPTTWTPAYGELTYQMLTDWIWESRRRERARTILANQGIRANNADPPVAGKSGGATIRVTSEDGLASMDGEMPLDGSTGPDESYDGGSLADAKLEAIDIFGYESNPDCFWELHHNDLTTTVVQPVYDQRNESKVVEKYLNKNTWTKKESIMRTANLLGVAAADLKINEILGLAPSHKLGPNGYPILLSNNGLVLHHPDLRSILEPLTNDPSERNSRILKPFFSSLDLVELEHILAENEPNLTNTTVGDNLVANFLALRNEAIDGKTGWRELVNKRTLDCQRRVQTRRQSFYYKPLDQFPFVLIIAIPQPYGSYKLEAQVEIKSPELPEKLTTYFTNSDFDLWNLHPDYRYCEGLSNNTITTLLDMFQRIEERKLNDIEWYPAESSKPPIPLPGKIYCDKELVQSLVYDSVATFSFSEDCGPQGPREDEPSLMSMFGVRFSFVATRSGLTRVRHHGTDDPIVKREALAFAKRHARAMDETYFRRTIDYNMLMNESATLIQVPFNTYQKILARLIRYDSDAQSNLDLGGLQPDGVNDRTLSSIAAVNGDYGSEDNLNAASGGSSSGGTKLNIKDMNLFEKLDLLMNSSLHVIATESIIVNEGAQRAVAGVTGVFSDYATFVMRFLNSTNAKLSDDEESFKKPAKCYLSGQQDPELCGDGATGGMGPIKCGLSNDNIDCLLVDNNGYILISEKLEFIGRHLKAYDQAILARLVANEIFHEVNITDHQSICLKQEEKPGTAGSSTSSAAPGRSKVLLGLAHLFASTARTMISNLMATLIHAWGVLLAICGYFVEYGQAVVVAQRQPSGYPSPLASPLILESQQQQSFQAMSALLPKKSYLRPCDRILTRYETRPNPRVAPKFDRPEYYSTRCNCPGWFVYEQVPMTNLILLIVDSASATCDSSKCKDSDNLTIRLSASANDIAEEDSLMMSQSIIVGQDDRQMCSLFERDLKLHKRKLDMCISHHQDEEQIKLCGSAGEPLGLLASAPLYSFIRSLSIFLLFRMMSSF